MTPSERLGVVVIAGSLAACAAAVMAGRWLVRWARSLKSELPEEAERRRRVKLNRCGRIAPGEVIDLVEDAPPEASLRRVVVYRYEVAGVTYEAAQDVSALPAAGFAGEGLEGLFSNVKYDPRKPMNSIIACEEWNGFSASKKPLGLTKP